MQPSDRMVHLTTVVGSFHGHVLAARLGSEGIPVELRGLSEGPYPLPANVSVFVHEDQLELARSLLLADAVDAVFDERYTNLGPGDAGALDLPPVDLPSVDPLPPRPHCCSCSHGRPRPGRGLHHLVRDVFSLRDRLASPGVGPGGAPMRLGTSGSAVTGYRRLAVAQRPRRSPRR